MKVRLFADTGKNGKVEHIPYVSYKWEKGMSMANFAWRICDYSKKAVRLGDGYIVIEASSLKYPDLKETCVAKGEWIVFDDKRRIVGTYDDKGHDEEYEIARDWR